MLSHIPSWHEESMCFYFFEGEKQIDWNEGNFPFSLISLKLESHWKWMGIFPLINLPSPKFLEDLSFLNHRDKLYTFWMWNLEFIPFLLCPIKSKIFILWVWKSKFWNQMYLSTYALEAFFSLQFGGSLKTNTSLV